MLSILIPSRNEPYLDKTIEDIKEHAEGEIEILAEEDKGLGQRALTNKLARQAKGDYLMKLDAHCSLSQGFDLALLSEIDDKTILSPLLLPLDGQSWTINGKKQMAQFVFDSNFVMQHAEGNVGETMVLQGSCWLITKKNYFDWNVCDESLGSWGMQSLELGIKAYLNGGVCKTTRNAYVGHLFRHKDEEFPYQRDIEPGKFANEEMKRRYYNKSIAGLIEKFNYPADWTKEIVDSLPNKI